MINKDSIVTAYDEHLTLVEWLQKVENALNSAVLTSLGIAKLSDKDNAATYQVTATFADNTTIASDSFTLPSTDIVTAFNSLKTLVNSFDSRIATNRENVNSILDIIDIATEKINADALKRSINGDDDVIVEIDNDEDNEKLGIHLSPELQSKIAKNTADIEKKQDKLTAGDGITISGDSSISIDASMIANAIVLRKFSEYVFDDTLGILVAMLFGNDFIKNYLTSIAFSFDGASLPSDYFSGKVVKFLPYPMKRITNAGRAFANMRADSEYSIMFPQLNESGEPVNFERAFFDIFHRNNVRAISFVSPTYVTEAYQAFYGLRKLESIDGLDMSQGRNIDSMLNACTALKHLGITHWHSSFDISSSTAFEKSDLVEIIGNLDPVTTAQTLTMGATNLAKLTDGEKKVATDKNWVLA